MRVEIDAGGRKVVIDCPDANVTPADVAAQALSTWRETSGAPAVSEGPGYGFTVERAGSPRSWPLADNVPLPVRAEGVDT